MSTCRGAHERNCISDDRSANRHLKRIRYGNAKPYYPDLTAAQPVTRRSIGISSRSSITASTTPPHDTVTGNYYHC